MRCVATHPTLNAARVAGYVASMGINTATVAGYVTSTEINPTLATGYVASMGIDTGQATGYITSTEIDTALVTRRVVSTEINVANLSLRILSSCPCLIHATASAYPLTICTNNTTKRCTPTPQFHAKPKSFDKIINSATAYSICPIAYSAQSTQTSPKLFPPCPSAPTSVKPLNFYPIPKVQYPY